MEQDNDLKKLILETNTLILNARKEQDEAIKNNVATTGEHTEKIKNMSDDFVKLSKAQEEIEKNQASIKKSLEIIEGFQNAAPDSVERNSKEHKAQVFNAVTSLMRNGSTGQNLNEFLNTEAGKEFNLMSTDSQADGGYTVNPVIEGMKKTRFFETSDIRAVSEVLTTSSNRVQIDIDDQEAEASRTAERSAASGTDTPEIGQITIDIHKYDAEPTITHEQVADSYFDGESWLNNKALDRIARYQNTDFVTGTGVNGAMGFLSYSAWATANTYERNKLEQLESSVSEGFAADDLIKLVGKLKSQYMNNNTVMGMDRRTFFEHLMLKKNGFGDYLFLENLKTALSGMRFLGIPVKMWDDMPVVAAAALSIVVGDFKQSYAIRDKPGTMFIRDMYTDKSRIKLYTASRTGGGVVNFEGIKILKIAA